MKINKRVVLLAVGFWASFAAQAVGPQVTAQFWVEDLATHKRTPVSVARLDQYVCQTIKGNLTTDGDHPYQLTVYDGLGREVLMSKGTITVKAQRWERSICYGFNEERDAPGTWWYVGELDGNPLFSESIEIRPAR